MSGVPDSYLGESPDLKFNVSALVVSLIILALPFYPIIKEVYVLALVCVGYLSLHFRGYRLDRSLGLFSFAIIYGFIIALFSLNFTVVKSAISWPMLLLFSCFLIKNIKIEWFAKFLCIVLVLFCLDAIFQYFHGVDILGNSLVHGGRASGPFVWHSPVIGSFAMVLFFLPELVLKSKLKKAVCYLIFITAIVLSGSRGALLQVLLCFLLVYASGLNRVLLTIFFGGGLSFVMFWAGAIESEAISRVVQLSNLEGLIEYESRGSGRLTLWFDYLEIMVREYWLFGAGLGGLEPYMLSLTGVYIHPHHLYLEIFLSFGLIGSVCLLVFYVRLYLAACRNARLLILSFWGPFNMLHSVFDFYWTFMMFLSISLVLMIERQGVR